MYTYRIEQAIRAAAILHKGQLRKGVTPLPYITHLTAVAMITSDYTDDEDVVVTAFLHDSLEDTDYTPKEMQEDFGGAVREAVEHLTQPEKDKSLSWKQKKKVYTSLLKKAPEMSLIVAAADKIHNMRMVVEEYYDDHFRFMKDFEGTLEDRVLMYQDIADILNDRLKNKILHEFNHVFTEYKNFIHDVQKSKKAYDER